MNVPTLTPPGRAPLALTAAPCEVWTALDGSDIVITGAGGVVGGALRASVTAARAAYGIDARVLLTGRRVVGQTAEHETTLMWDVTEKPPVRVLEWRDRRRPSFIVHCAAPTRSRLMVENPFEVFEACALGSVNVVRLAALLGTEGVVQTSSMEVYGKARPSSLDDRLEEHELGEVPPADVRSSYPLGKRAGERIFSEEAAVGATRFVSARLAAVVGKGVPLDDPRAVAAFLRAALSGKGIALATTGESVANYCAAEDAAIAMLLLACRGKSGAYNVVTEPWTRTVADTARLILNQFGAPGSHLRTGVGDPRRSGLAQDSHNYLSSARLRTLGWRPGVDWEAMAADWASMMRARVGEEHGDERG